MAEAMYMAGKIQYRMSRFAQHGAQPACMTQAPTPSGMVGLGAGQQGIMGKGNYYAGREFIQQIARFL